MCLALLIITREIHVTKDSSAMPALSTRRQQQDALRPGTHNVCKHGTCHAYNPVPLTCMPSYQTPTYLSRPQILPSHSEWSLCQKPCPRWIPGVGHSLLHTWVVLHQALRDLSVILAGGLRLDLPLHGAGSCCSPDLVTDGPRKLPEAGSRCESKRTALLDSRHNGWPFSSSLHGIKGSTGT